MKEVGIYEAKTTLPRLIHRVEAGESVTITRHGKPVARLVPVRDRKRVTEAIEAMKKFREGHSLGGLSIRELIDEGRRY
jgi:prevent-host-death family protein